MTTLPNRHQVRAAWHDYGRGLYFVTVCCADRKHLFGQITAGTMKLSPAGLIADAHIRNLDSHFDDVEVWNHVVMPNHIHILLCINGREPAISSAPAPMGCLRPKRHEAEPQQDFHHNSRLSVAMRCLKGGISRQCHRAGIPFSWQSRYHEHIVRDRTAYLNITEYIDNNIATWSRDCFRQD